MQPSLLRLVDVDVRRLLERVHDRAAEVYQRLGTAREIAGDYTGARDALGMALGLCGATGEAFTRPA